MPLRAVRVLRVLVCSACKICPLHAAFDRVACLWTTVSGFESLPPSQVRSPRRTRTERKSFQRRPRSIAYSSSGNVISQPISPRTVFLTKRLGSRTYAAKVTSRSDISAAQTCKRVRTSKMANRSGRQPLTSACRRCGSRQKSGPVKKLEERGSAPETPAHSLSDRYRSAPSPSRRSADRSACLWFRFLQCAQPAPRSG
jgi:hypothetical protein